MNLVPVGEFLILVLAGAIAAGVVVWLVGDVSKWRD